MSHFTDINGKKLLEIAFPEAKFQTIIDELNYESINNLSFDQRRIIFLVSFREFLKGRLSLDDFSEISNRIKMLFSDAKTKEQDDFEIAVYEAADLNIYLRNIMSDKDPMFLGLFQNVVVFFNTYKHLLEKLSVNHSQPAPLEKLK